MTPRTRLRRRLAVAAALPLVAITAACGSSSEAASPAAAPEAGSAFPVSVEHKYGTTTVEEEPTRVVSVGFADQDAVLAFGVAPVGIRDWYGEQPDATWPWAQDELGDAEPVVLPAGEIDAEAVAALEPDLIVGVTSGMTEADYATLSQIAPTVPQSAEFVDYGQPWQENTRMIGTALGQAERAEELIAEVEARFEQAQADHPELVGKTAAVAVSFEAGTINAYGPSDVRGRLLTDLGMQLPEPVVTSAADSFFATFSLEQLPQLDGDALVWGSYDADALARIAALPLRSSLEVTQGGEVFLDETESGAASFSSVLSLPALLDTLVPRLAAAVDGDPATTTG